MAAKAKAAPKPPATPEMSATPGGFTGFTDGFDTFFAGLAANMNREWFLANKPAFERDAKAPLDSLIGALTFALAVRDVPLTGDPKSSVFRINRDVRFSNDKSPYKLNVSGVLTRDGSKQSQGLLYVHVERGGAFSAMGFYGPEPEQLAALRDEIADHPDRWRAVRDALGAAGLALDREGALARLPRGYDADRAGAYGEDVRLKNFVVKREYSRAERNSAALVDQIADFATAGLPLLRFGWQALTRVQAPTHLRGPSAGRKPRDATRT